MSTTVTQQIEQLGVFPIIVIEDANDALQLGETLLAAGLPCAEVTFRTAAAEKAIRTLAGGFPELLVGAGTVLSVEQAQQAIDAGATFILSPGFNPKVVDFCLSQDVAIYPGIATPTEIEAAMAKGKPGPEFQSIRAHAPGVMRSFTMSRQWVYHDGVLDFELKELLRAYIALSGECSYCGGQGVARAIRDDQDELDELLNYERSDKYTDRQKLAMRYADAIMWNPDLADETMWKELRDEFTEPELVELGYWIGFTFGGQRWLRTLASSQGQLQAAS